MTDYRQKPNRMTYFKALYAMTLEHRVSPGLVYLYMPELAKRLGWGIEDRLWFAFLNGMTQNPITSLVMMEQLPECPAPGADLSSFDTWFNETWPRLQFDQDRVKNKRGTVQAVEDYAVIVSLAEGQENLYSGCGYTRAWGTASSVHTFGRLSTFSYLEYVHLNGLGPQCTDLMFNDREGSRSHRNGMLMLHGHDNLVWDKRAGNGCTGKYKNFDGMCTQMSVEAERFLIEFQEEHPGLRDVGNFTFESALCAFKNNFFSRRYPGVYADHGWERILWAEERGWHKQAETFKDIRAECLPDWLRIECTASPALVRERSSQFALTGFPYRGEFFL